MFFFLLLKKLRGKLEDFFFFTVNFDLSLSPNQSFFMVLINCREITQTNTHSHSHTCCKNKGNNNVSCVKDV